MTSSRQAMSFLTTVRSAIGRMLTTFLIANLPGVLAYNGFGVFAFDKAKMLVGDPTAAISISTATPTSNSSSGIIPTDFNGLTPPPAGAPNVFSVFTDDAFGDPRGCAAALRFPC